MPDQLVYRVRSVSSGWGGAPGLTSFYFEKNDVSGPEDSVAAEDVYTRVRAAWTAMAGLFPNAWSVLVTPEIDVINTDAGTLESSWATDDDGPVAGTIGAGFGPQVAMICSSYATPGIIDGRRVRGRSFLGPVVTGSDADGTPTAGQRTLVQTTLTALLGGTLGHPPMQVWSRPRPVSLSHPTGLGGSAHTISGVQVRDTYAILRSRRQ